MAINITESPVTSIIKSIPSVIANAQNTALARDQQIFNQNQQQLENQIMLDKNGMGAGGYNNAEIADYFRNISLSKGELITVPGGLDWSGHVEIPSREAAEAQYRAILQSQGRVWHPTQDQKMFESFYNEMIAERHNRIAKEIDAKLTARIGKNNLKIKVLIKTKEKLTIHLL